MENMQHAENKNSRKKVIVIALFIIAVIACTFLLMRSCAVKEVPALEQAMEAQSEIIAENEIPLAAPAAATDNANDDESALIETVQDPIFDAAAPVANAAPAPAAGTAGGATGGVTAPTAAPVVTPAPTEAPTTVPTTTPTAAPSEAPSETPVITPDPADEQKKATTLSALKWLVTKLTTANTSVSKYFKKFADADQTLDSDGPNYGSQISVELEQEVTDLASYNDAATGAKGYLWSIQHNVKTSVDGTNDETTPDYSVNFSILQGETALITKSTDKPTDTPKTEVVAVDTVADIETAIVDEATKAETSSVAKTKESIEDHKIDVVTVETSHVEVIMDNDNPSVATDADNMTVETGTIEVIEKPVLLANGKYEDTVTLVPDSYVEDATVPETVTVP